MRISHLTQMVQPYGRSSVLSRAASALPIAQAAAGHDVTVVALAPAHDVDKVVPNQGLARRLSPLVVDGEPALKVDILEGQLAGSRARLYLLVLPADVPEPDSFGRAAIALLKSLAAVPEVVHLHESTGADVDALREALDGPAVVVSVYDGRGEDPKVVEVIRDADTVVAPCRGLWDGDADPAPAVASALADHPKVRVLPAALDGATWNPAHDGALAATYAGDDLEGKAACRAALQKLAGLSPREGVPILAVWSRGGEDGGTAGLGELLDEIMLLDVQVVALPANGAQDDPFLAGLRERSGTWIAPKVDDTTLRQVLGGADAVLLPDLVAPMGERALIAMRYGLVPVARRVQAHRDVLVEYDAGSASGGAFLFVDEQECPQAVHRMVRAYRDGADWAPMMRANAQVNTGWERPLAHLEQIYQKALVK